VALSLITFDETARTVAALGAPSAIELPTLSAGGGASFSAAIREYHRAFEKDRARLKAEDAQVFRPCVFFLAHGAPKDRRYQETFRSLLGFDSSTGWGNRAYPNVIAIGLQGATRSHLLASPTPIWRSRPRGRWFVTDPAPTALDGYRSDGQDHRPDHHRYPCDGRSRNHHLHPAHGRYLGLRTVSPGPDLHLFMKGCRKWACISLCSAILP